MTGIKCTYSNGKVIRTSINGTLEDAQRYFLGQWFNVGRVEDDMQQCIRVEQIESVTV